MWQATTTQASPNTGCLCTVHRTCRLRSSSMRVQSAPNRTDQQPAPTQQNASGQAAPRRPIPSAAPGLPPGFKVERVEKLDGNVWEGAGVAAVDRGEDPNAIDIGRVALLVGGDIAALLLFAAVGRISHGESVGVAELFGTAWPFIAGVLLTSPVSGAYGKAAQSGKIGAAAVTALKTWALGIPAGLALRILSKGYIPDKAFLIVALAANLVLLLTWRTAAGAALPEVQTAAPGPAGRVNKKGNPLEFLQLLSGLVKRW